MAGSLRVSHVPEATSPDFGPSSELAANRPQLQIVEAIFWVERLPPEQPLDEIVSGHGEVLRHVAEDTGERPDPKWRVAWNGDVMLAAFGGGQAEVTTRLAGYPVAEVGECLREVVTGDVPRKPQALMTSSRTK